MRTADRFREAVEAGDHDALRALLAEDNQIFGPVVPEPVRGVRAAGAVLWAALSRLDGIRYVRVEARTCCSSAPGWPATSSTGSTSSSWTATV